MIIQRIEIWRLKYQRGYFLSQNRTCSLWKMHI